MSSIYGYATKDGVFICNTEQGAIDMAHRKYYGADRMGGWLFWTEATLKLLEAANAMLYFHETLKFYNAGTVAEVMRDSRILRREVGVSV